MVGAVNAKIDKLYASFGTPTGATYSDNTFTWTANSGQYMDMLTFAAGDLSKYAKLRLKATKTGASEIHYRIQFRASSGGDSKNVTNRYETSDTELVIDLSTITNIEYMTKIILFCDNSETGSINIKESEVYLETAEYDETMEISTTIDKDATVDTPFQWYTSTDGTSKTESTGDFYKKQFNTAGIKEIICKSQWNLGYGNGFIDVTGYDNITVNIETYDNTKDNQVRLLQATGEKSTTNYEIDLIGKGATIKSLSGLTRPWIAGIWTKSGSSNSQAISSVVFTKQYKAYKAVGAPAFEIAASSGSTVAYDRTFPTDKKSTVCLPFALTEAEVTAAGTFYELTSAADGTLTFSEVSETEAYKPYVFEANTANPFASLTNKVIVASEGQACQTTVDGYTFQGTLAHQSLPSGVYGYNAANGVFSVTTTDAVTIDAFRGYIINSGGLAREIRCVFGNEITGINEVKSQKAEENDILYSPSGQRVSADYKGIVIKNGRKYFKE